MRAVIYWRYSKREQSTYSEAAQIRACKAHAERNGMVVVKVYGDPGISAKAIKKRKSFKAMLRDARAGSFDVLLVHKLDRFSRSLVDTFMTLGELYDHNVTVTSVTESQFDFTTPNGRMFLAIAILLAQWYIENLAQETRKGKEERARQGGWNGALPFGYTTPKKIMQQIEEDEPKAEELQAYLESVSYEREIDAIFEPFEIQGYRLAVELYETGQYSDTDIANALNDQGYRTSGHWGANPFSKDTISPILKNRFYAGFVQYKGEWMDGKHQAAIPLERWEKLQAIRQKRTYKRRTTKSTDRVYPFRKVARCRECGTLLRGHYARGRRHYRDPAHDYGKDCGQKTTFRAKPVEDQLGAFLADLVLPEGWRERIMELVKATAGDTDPDRAERARLEGQLERAKRLFILGDLDEPAYKVERNRIMVALSKLRLPSDPAIDLIKAAELLSNLKEVWSLANDGERARIVGTIFETIWIEESKIVSVEPKPAFYRVMMVCHEEGKADGEGDPPDGGCMSDGNDRPVAPAGDIQIIPPKGRHLGGLFRHALQEQG